MSCEYCNKPIYIKAKVYTRSIFTPLTLEGELRDKLTEMTGEDYFFLPHNFCPICGKKLKEDNNDSQRLDS